MATLEITDQCLVPEENIIMNYSGTDPWGVAKKISGSLKEFFHVSTSGIKQPQINWDITGDPIKFYTTWSVKKDLSRFSHIEVTIIIQGTKTKVTNTGEFTLVLKGNLNTNFEGMNAFLRTVWPLYSYLFYNRTRAGFLQTCRDFIIGFRNEIKDHFSLRANRPATYRGSMG